MSLHFNLLEDVIKRSITILIAMAFILIMGCEKQREPVAPVPQVETSMLITPAADIPADLKAKIMAELGTSDPDTSGLQKSPGLSYFIDLLGDIDNFHPGDAVDDQGMTDEGGLIVICLGGIESEIPRLDEPAVVDRPIAIAHFFNSRLIGSIPMESRIKEGVILFRFKGNRQDVLNDFILFLNPCEAELERQLPIIIVTLKDLLAGDAPAADEIHTITMNLQKVPVRKFLSYADFLKSMPEPGNSWPGEPDQKSFNLLKYLYKFNPYFAGHSYLDMVIVDGDLTLDYSIFAGVVNRH